MARVIIGTTPAGFPVASARFRLADDSHVTIYAPACTREEAVSLLFDTIRRHPSPEVSAMLDPIAPTTQPLYTTPTVDGAVYLVRAVPVVQFDNAGNRLADEFWIEAWTAPASWRLIHKTLDQPDRAALRAALVYRLNDAANANYQPAPLDRDELADELDRNGATLDPEDFFV